MRRGDAIELAAIHQSAALDPAPGDSAPDLADDRVERSRPKCLRVSTREQAERGGREEGFSIPAQREANRKKAQSMGAMVVKEFVERGVSGTTTNRPALQAMLRYLGEEAEHIDYVIVHKVDRLARNRADDVELNKRFDEFGVRLVSTSENIDQSPGGLLLHGIMSSIAEFYSKNLSNEVKKEMTEKVRSGGSVGRAPLGYRNVRDMRDGREIRTVEVDLNRAPLITWAFEQYATGNYSVRSLTAALNARGLTTPQTAKFPEKPVEVRQVHQVLTNPYYLGVVTYKGAQHPGKHAPLITPDLFEQVQQLLSSKINGERSVTHDHYLKSTLYCGQCGFRMIVQVATARNGEEYPYYSCLGRHSKRNNCDLRSIQIVRVEQLIQDLYDRIALSTVEADWLESTMKRELKTLTKDTDQQRDALTAQKMDAERKQRKLLEAQYNDAIPIEMLRSEQKRLDQELAAVSRDLETLSVDLEKNERYLSMAIEIARYAADAYRRAPEQIRRMLNQVLFERLDVHMTEGDEHRFKAVLAPPFKELFAIARRTRGVEPDLASAARRDHEGENQKIPAVSGGDLPSSRSISCALVSNRSKLVGLAGFEPTTP